MMVYIDAEYRCHTSNPDGEYRAVETDFFGEKCDEMIEGYRLVPAGETWARDDGEIFAGEMLAPWKDYGALDAAQREYERQQIAEMQEASASAEAAETAYTEGVQMA